MELTVEELAERIAAQYDECDLIDLLGLDGPMIVEAFKWIIEDNYDKLLTEILYDEEELDESGDEACW
jgi:hypothetical protein